MICEYENNVFCGQLSAEDKALLCKHCQRFVFKKKMDARIRCKEVSDSLLPPDKPHCPVVIQGLMCTNNAGSQDMPKAYLIWQPGDMVVPEEIFGGPDALTALYNFHYLADGAYAIFPTAVLKARFMESPDFAALLFHSLANTRLRQTKFLLGTQLKDAYSSVMFLLLFCKEHRIPALTHQEFAYLTNLNRVTVTRILKQILAKEDLGQSLMEYTLSVYEGE